MIKTEKVNHLQIRTISEICKNKWISDEDCEDGGFYTDVMVPLKKPKLVVHCDISVTCTQNEKLITGAVYGTSLGGAYMYTGESMVLSAFNHDNFTIPENFFLVSTTFKECDATN